MSMTPSGFVFVSGGGWVGQAGSWFASLFSKTGHGGGIVGENVGVSLDKLSANISKLPKYHNGNEYAAVLKENEGVFTPEQMKALLQGGGGNGKPQVINNINIQAPDGKLSKESLHQLQRKMGQSVNKAMRRG